MLRRAAVLTSRNGRMLAARQLQTRAQSTLQLNEQLPLETETPPEVPVPLAVKAIYHEPLKRTAQYNVPVCDLQIRSFSVQNLEFFCDFALRAAYYLELPASGPVPLPRRVERWAVPKSNFVHKKAQQNFERVTFKRMIQIKDGHPDVVQIWLAFLKKHEYYGIGMKANVWTFEQMGTGRKMAGKIEETRGVASEKGLTRAKQLGSIKEAFRLSHKPLGTKKAEKTGAKYLSARHNESEYFADLEPTSPALRKIQSAVGLAEFEHNKIIAEARQELGRSQKSTPKFLLLERDELDYLATLGPTAQALWKLEKAIGRAEFKNNSLRAELVDLHPVLKLEKAISQTVLENKKLRNEFAALGPASSSSSILQELRPQKTRTLFRSITQTKEENEPEMPDEHEEQEYKKRQKETTTPTEVEEAQEREKPGTEPGVGDKPEKVEDQHMAGSANIHAQKPEEKHTSAPVPGEEEIPPNPSENEELVHRDREDEVPKELKDAKERQKKGEEPAQEPSATATKPTITANKSDSSLGNPEDQIPREMEEGQEEGKKFS